MHFNGQSTIAIDGDGATGESYCFAPTCSPMTASAR